LLHLVGPQNYDFAPKFPKIKGFSHKYDDSQTTFQIFQKFFDSPKFKRKGSCPHAPCSRHHWV